MNVSFRFTTAGESHGRGLVGILEGVPAGLAISAADVDVELKRPMGGYVSLPAAWRTSKAKARPWVAKSLDHVAAMPAKRPTKKAARKR